MGLLTGYSRATSSRLLIHDYGVTVWQSERGGGLSGGLLSSIFGSLFGGKRAGGGSVSAGRLYMVGENGPEYLAMGGQSGHVYNQRQMSGGEQRTIVAFGDREIGRATDSYGTHTGRPQGKGHARQVYEKDQFSKLRLTSHLTSPNVRETS